MKPYVVVVCHECLDTLKLMKYMVVVMVVWTHMNTYEHICCLGILGWKFMKTYGHLWNSVVSDMIGWKHMKTYETDMNIHVGFDMVCWKQIKTYENMCAHVVLDMIGWKHMKTVIVFDMDGGTHMKTI